MKMRLLHLFLAVCVLSAGCASFKNRGGNSTLPATALNTLGRSFTDSSKQLHLLSSAAHFGFSFSGTSCSIYTALPSRNAHGYLQYELDGVYQKRLRVNGADTLPLVITAPSGGKHTVWIYKATEAHTGDILINRISGAKVTSLKIPALPLIEFIGNSITCGAAADPSDTPCGTGDYQDQHNAYQAYGPVLARTLGANFMLSSVSGIGIYRNWNSNGPTMPQVYEKIDLQENSLQFWNFDAQQPAIVSIALGTNDFSNGDGKKPRLPFDSAAYVGNYVQFIQVVRSKYPKAKIVLLSSPMMNGSPRALLQNCLSTVKQKVDEMYPAQKSVSLFFFEPMNARGCSGHPNVEDHAILAKELSPLFSKLLAE